MTRLKWSFPSPERLRYVTLQSSAAQMEPLWRTGAAQPSDSQEVVAEKPRLRVALVDDHQEFLTWARALLSARLPVGAVRRQRRHTLRLRRAESPRPDDRSVRRHGGPRLRRQRQPHRDPLPTELRQQRA